MNMSKGKLCKPECKKNRKKKLIAGKWIWKASYSSTAFQRSAIFSYNVFYQWRTWGPGLCTLPIYIMNACHVSVRRQTTNCIIIPELCKCILTLKASKVAEIWSNGQVLRTQKWPSVTEFGLKKCWLDNRDKLIMIQVLRTHIFTCFP